MKNLMYLLVAASLCVFAACGGGETNTEETAPATEETVVEESILQVTESCSICGEAVCLAMGNGPCLVNCACCTNIEDDDMSAGNEEEYELR